MKTVGFLSFLNYTVLHYVRKNSDIYYIHAISLGPKIVYLENFPYIFDPPSHFSWSKSVQDLFAEIAHSREGQFAATRVEKQGKTSRRKEPFLNGNCTYVFCSFHPSFLKYVKQLKNIINSSQELVDPKMRIFLSKSEVKLMLLKNDKRFSILRNNLRIWG